MKQLKLLCVLVLFIYVTSSSKFDQQSLQKPIEKEGARNNIIFPKIMKNEECDIKILTLVNTLWYQTDTKQDKLWTKDELKKKYAEVKKFDDKSKLLNQLKLKLEDAKELRHINDRNIKIAKSLVESNAKNEEIAQMHLANEALIVYSAKQIENFFNGTKSTDLGLITGFTLADQKAKDESTKKEEFEKKKSLVHSFEKSLLEEKIEPPKKAFNKRYLNKQFVYIKPKEIDPTDCKALEKQSQKKITKARKLIKNDPELKKKLVENPSDVSHITGELNKEELVKVLAPHLSKCEYLVELAASVILAYGNKLQVNQIYGDPIMELLTAPYKKK